MQHGLYPISDWKACGKIDEIIYSWADLLNAFAAIALDQDTSVEEKATKISELGNGLLRKFLVVVERQLSSQAAAPQQADFLVGESISIADFAMAALLFNIVKNEHGIFKEHLDPLLAGYPLVSAYS